MQIHASTQTKTNAMITTKHVKWQVCIQTHTDTHTTITYNIKKHKHTKKIKKNNKKNKKHKNNAKNKNKTIK